MEPTPSLGKLSEATEPGMHAGSQSKSKVISARRGVGSILRQSSHAHHTHQPSATSIDVNLDAAIEKHAEWRVKLRSAISNHEQLDVLTIAKDNCCQLGQWLHGGGKTKYGSNPEFQSIIPLHRAFHVEAGKVAELINAKKYSEAEQALHNGTSYADASDSVRNAIYALKKHIAPEPKWTAASGTRRGPVGRMQAALATAVKEDPDWKEF